MSKVKLVDRIFDSESICFVYDPFLLPRRPYWTASALHRAKFYPSSVSTRPVIGSSIYLIYDNLLVEMQVIGFSNGEKLITRLLATL